MLHKRLFAAIVSLQGVPSLLQQKLQQTGSVAGRPARTNEGIRPMSGEIKAVYRLANDHVPAPAAAAWPLRQVREEKGVFHIPDFITAEPFDSHAEAYAAANDHALPLRRAEQQLDDVLNLARLLRASVQSEDDARAMQAETVLKIIEKKLSKARDRMDRHDASHLNLFIAYFDLKEKSGGTIA